jgi:hypothetical protein
MLEDISKFYVCKFNSSVNFDMFVAAKQIRRFDGSPKDIRKNYPTFQHDNNQIQDAVKAALKFISFEKNNVWSTKLFFDECIDPKILLSSNFERLQLECMEKKNILRYYSGTNLYMIKIIIYVIIIICYNSY